MKLISIPLTARRWAPPIQPAGRQSAAAISIVNKSPSLPPTSLNKSVWCLLLVVTRQGLGESEVTGVEPGMSSGADFLYYFDKSLGGGGRALTLLKTETLGTLSSDASVGQYPPCGQQRWTPRPGTIYPASRMRKVEITCKVVAKCFLSVRGAYFLYIVYWHWYAHFTLTFYMNSTRAEGGRGPQRLIRALGIEAGNPIMSFRCCQLLVLIIQGLGGVPGDPEARTNRVPSFVAFVAFVDSFVDSFCAFCALK